MTADRRSVSEQPPCKVCEGWGAYCDDHRPPVSGEPTRMERWTVRNSQGKEVEMSIHDHDGGEHCFSSCPAWRGASTGAALDVERLIEQRTAAIQLLRGLLNHEYINSPMAASNVRDFLARLAEQEGEER